MVWNTTTGSRTLQGVEAQILGQTAWQLCDSIREEKHFDSQCEFGIVLFDQLSWQQQLVMLDKVLKQLLDAKAPALPASALMDATVAAIYAQMRRTIEIEIDFEQTAESAEEDDTYHRQQLADALHQLVPEGDWPDPECVVMDSWELAIESLQGLVLADEDYQMPGIALDLPPEKSREFKATLGIGNEYFVDIPPDATHQSAAEAWANIVQRVSGSRPELNAFE